MGMMFKKRVGKVAVEFIRKWDPMIIALDFSAFNANLLSTAHAMTLFKSSCYLFAASNRSEGEKDRLIWEPKHKNGIWFGQ